ncbi:hypothetical protein Tsubulata_044699 [Turnera subulata]|uniref:Uncharacterized protein n=1 Tax=Turnera subulata TaxID=218843 RepID=A0A9Q0G9G9_9ROSI|nr:hypothetical protein Tsubulata_044699 [Turnera subulata]
MAGEGEGPTIGVALGATNSCVGVWNQGRVNIIPHVFNSGTIPSYVAFADSHVMTGVAAKAMEAVKPSNTIFGLKNFIGKKYSEVQSYIPSLPFKVIPVADQPMIVVEYQGKATEFAAVDILSTLLQRIRRSAESYLSTTVKSAVLTVPPYFNDSQRQATMAAASTAGLKVLRLIDEPTAAAIAYGLDTTVGEKNVLIFDMGGGSLDVSLLTIKDGLVEVKATVCHTNLGGNTFVNRMVHYLTEQFSAECKINIAGKPKSLGKLRAACESAKTALSYEYYVAIDVRDLSEGVHFRTTMTRAKFEDLNWDLFTKCLEPLQKCLRDAGMDKSSVNDVVVVGGSTRIPMVQKLLRDFFDGKALCTSENFRPDEAVAYGAALHAAILTGQAKKGDGMEPVNVIPLSFGLKTACQIQSVWHPSSTLACSTDPEMR